MWEQFARDSERDIRTSAPKEPSARARMVTERLRQQDARGVQPEGWRTGPALQEINGRAARRRRLWAVIGVPLAIAVAVVAMKPSLLPGDPFGTASSSSSPSDGPGAASQLPDETARPTAAPSAVASDTPTLDRPFAGSPAERWADGASGIVVPKATPVGSLTQAQVATALRQTKTLLVDANLNPATLRGDRPEAALGTLDPKQPGMLEDANSWLRKPGKDSDPLALFSRFDPDEARLVGDVVKTRGRMTFKAGEHASVAIHVDYTFVYPLTPADGRTEVTRTIVRRVLDVEVADRTKYQATPGKLAIVRYDQDLSNSACDVYDGFLHPQFPSSAPSGAAPSGPTVDPYDRSRDIRNSAADSCGTVSRT
ncbi:MULTISPECIES: hypothetical protein [Streptomyces]|uniref:Tat pathway signal protein n=1 Tax=Streptomyces dengpaensis TaxID=2049881 RepID=A0ABM6SRU4_9ACTN|nr:MULTISPECIES: hypothetical protein [Streptomyces]AVH56996.1 hypothetical protein C4B68_15785 [Streptomyces dengpaensis]PIB09101.1 hypothetical protein B1C81_12735 [Streptomyces sp. HG99]